MLVRRQTFGDPACHPSLRSGSGSTDGEILRCAQDDRQNPFQGRSREVFSPNVKKVNKLLDFLAQIWYRNRKVRTHSEFARQENQGMV